MSDEPKVVYLTRNGMLEPLGQSQVLSYLRQLAGSFHISLISFEKAVDLTDTEAAYRVRADCEATGIHWIPRRFRAWPRVIAPAWSLLELLILALRASRGHGPKLIHARSYLPAAAAWAASRLTGVPFIFDMRALWPEELITAGRLQRDSALHRLVLWIERICIRNAFAVVSLTEAALEYLEEQYPDELKGKRIEVIPTCADLDRFSPTNPSSTIDAPIRIGCCGTVLSGWFRLDWLVQLFDSIRTNSPSAEFEIVTRDSENGVRKALKEVAADSSHIQVYSATPAEMPDILRAETANVMLYAGGQVSELGRSPTRMAEVLGCGRPVVANRGVGDVAEIVERYRVGVLMESDAPEDVENTVEKLLELLQDPELSTRCRRAAEEVFSLESGVAAYRQLYRDVLD